MWLITQTMDLSANKTKFKVKIFTFAIFNESALKRWFGSIELYHFA